MTFLPHFGRGAAVFDVSAGIADQQCGCRLLTEAITPSPAWAAGLLDVIARARRWMSFYAVPSAFIACAKIGALGQLEAKYNRMRRVLRVTTAASFSSRMRNVSICALANSVPLSANARMRSMSR